MAPLVSDHTLISVIVPVYNAAKWLGELFSSLAAQTYTCFEVILVDDGSTDSSPEICRRQCAADSRFRYLRKENGGQASARNLGIEHARGEWIFFADADDALQPCALQRLYEVALSVGTDIVVGGFHNGESMPQPPSPSQPQVMAWRQAVEKSLYQQPALSGIWGTLYRRSIFLPDGPRFVAGLYYEDLDIHYRLLEKARKIAILPEKLYFYRRNPSSFINTVDRRRLDALTVTDRMLQHYRGTELENAARDRRFSAHFNILLMLLGSGFNAPEALEKCCRVVHEGRRKALSDPKVRLKNKIGALLSYGGMPLLRLISKSTSHENHNPE